MKTYAYRLESPWSDWDEFFCNEFQYTCTRVIDLVHLKGLLPTLQPLHDWCGVWYFKNFADAVLFQEREPYPTEDRGKFAVTRLSGRGGGEALRFCIRIDETFFNASMIFPDRALNDSYKSAYVHLRQFNTGGKQWRTGQISSDRIPHIGVPDQFVSIFFDGHWYPKSPDLGRKLHQLVTERETADGFLISQASEHAPQQRVLTLPTSTKETIAPRSKWLSRWWRKLARSETV